MKKLFLILFFVPFLLNAQEDGSDLIKLNLQPDVYSIEPGQKFLLALHFDIEEGWHTYWRNAGDAGLPVEVEWALPEGFKLLGVYWPVPEKLKFDDMAEYSYEKEFYLFASIQSPEKISKKFEITANANWLICKEKCIPGSGSASTTVEVNKQVAANMDWFQNIMPYYYNTLPGTKTDWKFDAAKTDSSVILTMEIPERFNSYRERIKSFEFYPYEGGIFNNYAEQPVVIKDKYVTLEIKYDQFKVEEPKYLEGILVTERSFWYPSDNGVLEVKIPVK